jgi:hypothetical protein
LDDVLEGKGWKAKEEGEKEEEMVGEEIIRE